MPKNLAASDLDLLQSHANAGDRIAYYSQLSAWGYTYGTLALGVVTQETFSGRAANWYFVGETGITGGDTLATVSLGLMNRDLAARIAAQGNDISYDVIQDYHEDAFAEVNAPITAWTPTRALDEWQTGPERQQLWETLLTSEDLTSGAALLHPEPWLELEPGETGAEALARLADYAVDLSIAGGLAAISSAGELGGFEVALAGGGKLIALLQSADVAAGTAADDTLMGYAGNDMLSGGDGTDRLYGGEGDDILWSGELQADGWHARDSYADWLVGGVGHDHYHGGGGTVFALVDDYWVGTSQYGNLNPVVRTEVDHIIDDDGLGTIYNPYASLGDSGFEHNTVWFTSGVTTTFAVSTSRHAFDALVYKTALPINSYTVMYAFLTDLYPDDGNDALDLVVGQYDDYITLTYVIRNFYQGDFGILIPDYTKVRDTPPSTGENSGDIIRGTISADTLIGGSGDDNIVGDAGNDMLVGNNGDDRIWGHLDNDTIIGGAGADFMDGGEGFDTVSYATASTGIYLHSGNHSASTGDAAGDTILNFEAIRGSEYGDEFIFVEDGVYVFAGGGDDTVTLAGIGGIVYGEAGKDTIYGSAGVDNFYGDTGDDELYGEDGNDIIEGGADNDTIYGGAGLDKLHGDGGSDYIYGDDDNDELYGGDGDDELFGGLHSDRLDGGGDNDWLVGGSGADKFIFSGTFGTDSVADFELGIDQIVISNHPGLNFNSLINGSAEWGGNSWLSINGNTIILYGVALATLTQPDFQFA